MLTITANVEVKSEHLEAVKSAMLEMVAATLQEPGCVRYELHQDNNEPTKLIFVETWESRELWQDHMNGSAVANFQKTIPEGAVDATIQELSQIA